MQMLQGVEALALNAPTGQFSQVSAGFAHACAVSTEGAVVCWGCNL
jgi:alpha-tubulin suppressor-like RCC1 family protein